MIIFGWRSRTSVDSSGTCHCPVCGGPQMHVVVRTRPWFTLFFVPIFPVSGGSSHLACCTCQSVFGPPQTASGGTLPVQPAAAQAVLNGSPATTSPLNPPGGQVPFQPVTMTSTPAIVSLVLGVLSPFFLIACFLSLLSSIAAIVCGHVALVSIKRSQGRLQGTALAIAGLGLGYAMLAVTVAALVWFVRLDFSDTSTGSGPLASTVDQSLDERLREAEFFVTSDSHGELGAGNSETASQLAVQFAAEMKVIEETAFTRSRERVIQLSGGNFLTHCELQEDSCALIVHVPAYKDYKKVAKRLLAELAWQEAVQLTADVLDEGDELAVALRGTFLYGDIMLGKHPGTNASQSTWLDGSRRDLLPFFASRSLPQSVAPPETNGAEVDALPPPALAEEAVTPPSPGTTPADGATIRDAEPIPDPFDLRDLPDEPRPTPRPSRPARPSPPAPDRETRPAFENRVGVRLATRIKAEGWNIQALAFSGDQRYLLAGRLDQTISVFDARSGELVYQSPRYDDLQQFVSLTPTRDGRHFIAGGYSGATRLMRLEDSGTLTDIKSLFKYSREAKCIVTSPSFDFTLGGDRDGTLAWQPYDKRSANARTLSELKSAVLAAYLPPEGHRASATDGKVLLHFSLKDGKAIEKQELGKGSPMSAAFHPDGTHVAISDGSTIREHATDAPQRVQTFVAPGPSAKGGGIQWTIGYHPTEPWLISGGSGAATVWDRGTGERLAVLECATSLYVQTLSCSKDGRWLAIVPAAAGQTIEVFEFTEL